MRRITIIAALVAAACLVSAPIASAESDESIDFKGGAVEFVNYPDGSEGLWAYDELADRRGVRAYLDIYNRDGSRQTVHVTALNSTADRHNTLHNQIREGTRVVLSACYVKRGRATRCSLGQNARA